MQHGDCCQKPVEDWPESWHEVKRKRFKERVMIFGIIEESNIKVVAHAIENLGADEQDLIDYLTHVKATQEKIGICIETLAKRMLWSSRLLDFFKIEKEGLVVVGILKILCLILLGPFVIIINFPAKFTFHRNMRRLVGSVHPSFMSFLASRRHLV